MTSERPSGAVVEAVAAATGRDPLDLPVLHRSVDTVALDTLLTVDRSSSRSTVAVEFDYAGVTVVADSDDGVSVRIGAPEREVDE